MAKQNLPCKRGSFIFPSNLTILFFGVPRVQLSRIYFWTVFRELAGKSRFLVLDSFFCYSSPHILSSISFFMNLRMWISVPPRLYSTWSMKRLMRKMPRPWLE